ncbi:MAG: inner membrane CreD family protein [Calditrichaceae bacterium]|nr:inner membrane CreD family protein [Calditrichaceae bacterium]RQV96961.1 MAG: hypothetical protein EH224_02950 [Calditrichota bacterium]
MATTWVRNSPGIRLTIIGLLTFILFIGSLIIRDLISEREHRRIEAVSEVSEKWGKAQVISGPVLTIPYLVYFKKNNDEVYSSTYYAHFLPENLDIKGEVDPQIRRRGIYEIVLYGSRLQLSGNFTLPDFSLLNIMDKDILWNDAFLGIGVSDMVGIQDVIKIKWNKDEFKANPGIETNDVFSTGLSAPVSVNKNEPGYTFSISLDINGSESLMFTPVGQKSEANISSTWENPGFDGRYIPDDHQITDQGFTANWKILHLNRD